MRVVALSGWKRSGKDTVADFMVESYNFTKTAFATPLKQAVSIEHGIQLNWFNDTRYKDSPILKLPVVSSDSFSVGIHKLLKAELKSGYWTPRALMILKGSTNRAVTPKYWTKILINQIKTSAAYSDFVKNDIFFEEPNSNNFVITDLRFKSEAEELKNAFGDKLITIRINRFASIDTADSSERNLDDYKFDFVVENKGSVEELKSKIITII